MTPDLEVGSDGKLAMWAAIIAGFVLTLVVLVACAYAWVYLYSVFIHTGGDQAHYEAYAKVASPIVAVIMVWPVFYFMGRFMRRFGNKALLVAMAVVGLNLLADIGAVASLAEDVGYNVAMSALSAVGKILAAYFGAGGSPRTQSSTAVRGE